MFVGAPDMAMGASILSFLFAYLAVFTFGVPAFYSFRDRGLARIWVAAITGLIGGVVTWLIVLVVVGLLLDESLPLVISTLLKDSADLPWFGLAGLLGMIVALVFWLIARPDHRTGKSN